MNTLFGHNYNQKIFFRYKINVSGHIYMSNTLIIQYT